MTSGPAIAGFREAVLRVFPELAGATFTCLGVGWHSTAVDVDDRLIFKFPHHEAAERALMREASLLAVVRPAVSMPVPDLTLHSGPPLFSRHEKIRGGHLLTEQYDRLTEQARRDLAERLARFYAELHGLDPEIMRRAGAGPVEAWLPPDVIVEKALPALPAGLRAVAGRAVAEWRELPPDPYGIVYGFFDGHGWNMAFDHDGQKLNGVYDFADSGFGARHQEFIYSSFISPDLTEQIVTGYEALTGRRLDRRRIALLTGILRLSELAQHADHPDHGPAMIRNVAEWAGTV